jgi:hypothetical protein
VSEADDVLLGRAHLERAFTDLGERLARRGVVADVFVKPTVTSAPPTASEACSANSANPPASQKTRTEWATVLPTADPPTA